MDAGGIGWRELMILAAVVAAAYLVIALLALARMRRRPAAPVAPAIEPTAPAEPGPAFKPVAEKAWAHPFLTPVPPPVEEPLAGPVEVDVVMAGPASAQKAPAPASPFAAALGLTELEAEVRQLRADVAAMRNELTELKEARRVSPLYADAAALAHRGFDARGVAEECGISVAEAELVLAMSREDKTFDSEVDDGADGNRHEAAN